MACFIKNSTYYSIVSWYDACNNPSGPDNLAFDGSSSIPQLGDTVYTSASCTPGNQFANAFINLDGTPGNVYRTDGGGVYYSNIRWVSTIPFILYYFNHI